MLMKKAACYTQNVHRALPRTMRMPKPAIHFQKHIGWLYHVQNKFCSSVVGRVKNTTQDHEHFGMTIEIYDWGQDVARDSLRGEKYCEPRYALSNCKLHIRFIGLARCGHF
uniref:Uncharacterized protein n=1 Tax=Rhipicephalus microplus TaxID=6941 RepID=A0A6G5AHG4_RHIMP